MRDQLLDAVDLDLCHPRPYDRSRAFVCLRRRRACSDRPFHARSREPMGPFLATPWSTASRQSGLGRRSVESRVGERRKGAVAGRTFGGEPSRQRARATRVGRGMALGRAEPRSPEPPSVSCRTPSPTRKRFHALPYPRAGSECSGRDSVLDFPSAAPVGKKNITSIVAPRHLF
jgi:hypothetical protein